MKCEVICFGGNYERVVNVLLSKSKLKLSLYLKSLLLVRRTHICCEKTHLEGKCSMHQITSNA